MAPTGRFDWRAFWALCKPYWTSEDRWKASGLLAAVIVLNLGQVYLNVLFTDWNKTFYDALQDKNWDDFVGALAYFAVLSAIFIVVAVVTIYLQQLLQIRWRSWLTDRYLTGWLGSRSYYLTPLVGDGNDNPDQRIAEDLRQFVSLTLTLSLGLLSAIVSLASFATLLWVLSGPLDFTAFGFEITVPGYLMWAAILYAMLGTWLIHLIGRPLIRLNFMQERYEADFRFGMARLREYAEAVALSAGEPREHAGLMQRFGNVIRNYHALMVRQLQLGLARVSYNQAAVIFPFAVVSPAYFSGRMQLGDVMQTASAFDQVRQALSYIIDSYTSIADWRAVCDRLTGFRLAVAAAEARMAESMVTRESEPRSDLTVESLDVGLPDGRVLYQARDVHLAAGERVLVRGPSGSGKSTLFRVLAGIWPFGQGKVRLPQTERVMFLPQRPYLPLGTLEDALCYPDAPTAFDDAAKEEALRAAELAPLADRLKEERPWAQTLSPGEQQRLALARAFLRRPEWLFLDEATSALDEATERRLYERLRERLPQAMIASIGHRPTLATFHQRALEVHPEATPPQLVASAV
ncbi:ABC transporter ATP-binding protein/permease [Desertibaculum subflavum]|uniref:ABC transporter ATP-binding protein/permease n=1 Tax=Desertibaculum subflavum TaxID=2268458 RepID=UPI000E66C6EB